MEKQEWASIIAGWEVKETSVDGGKVRLRKEEGEGSHWLDYKAVRLHDSYYGAFFLDNQALINYVNSQPLSELLTCLGDGHDNIWNIIVQLNPDGARREILDWYHLVENLCKVGGSLKHLAQGKEFLFLDESRKPSIYLSLAVKNKPRTFVLIWRSIADGLLTTSNCQHKRFAQSVREL